MSGVTSSLRWHESVLETSDLIGAFGAESALSSPDSRRICLVKANIENVIYGPLLVFVNHQLPGVIMQLLLHVLNAVVVKQFEVLASRYGRHRVGAVGVMLVIIIASVIWGMSKSGISVQKGTYVGETSTGVKILLTIDADHSTLRVGHDAYDLKIVGSFQDGLEFACYCQDTDGLRGAMMVLHGPFVDRNGLKLIVGVRGLEAAVDMQRDYTYYAGAK